MNFDKITNVLGVFTPIMIVMIFIITGYSFIGKSHDWTTLEALAHTIKPATSNVWFSVINYYSLWDGSFAEVFAALLVHLDGA